MNVRSLSEITSDGRSLYNGSRLNKHRRVAFGLWVAFRLQGRQFATKDSLMPSRDDQRRRRADSLCRVLASLPGHFAGSGI